MESYKREDIARELKSLGWSDGHTDVLVYEDFRLNQTNYEYIVYAKYPLWKWDFVAPYQKYINGNVEYFDITYRPGTWQGQLRWDWESKIEHSAKDIAFYINADFEDFLDTATFAEATDPFLRWAFPVQRVTDRPKSGTLG